MYHIDPKVNMSKNTIQNDKVMMAEEIIETKLFCCRNFCHRIFSWEQWYHDNNADLPKMFKQQINFSKSTLSCKFGDSHTLQTAIKFTLPSSIPRIKVLQILRFLKRKKNTTITE